MNPPEAVYCMTCATSLSGEPPREERRWEEYRSDEPAREGGRAQASYSADSGSARGEEGRFEKLGPAVEDFAFDLVRAAAKLYFNSKDPNQPFDPHRRGGREPSMGDRLERLKDVIAEARVTYRSRGEHASGDRPRR